MKDSTSAQSLTLENHLRACWLSEDFAERLPTLHRTLATFTWSYGLFSLLCWWLCCCCWWDSFTAGNSDFVINMWLMLVTQVQSSSSTQKAYAAFPHVAPDTLQYFQYESVSFTCEGFDSSLGWKLMRKIPSENMACGTNWGVLNGSLCVFRNVYVEDSGQYWCETRDGKRSNTVNITVTAGSVIMESPVLPVMEGDDVTLRCKSKTASSSISASFYKNGLLVNNEGKLTICNVSRSDEGLYKCSISDGGESPESLLPACQR
ncbi:Fc receptor-like protein 5 [Embiotoca jacksoni]|uniref:Fc receptor-like protein 5 n=1 Tax=Embiotoca jacksoni TaxID=100190 RepID=UPI003703F62B